ncbi:kinase-like domain-containing protein [Apodospora peruviana]|uniref:Kinase-like domain-containing protein n=1 Tax=Apodospora peruviana TaxID=516989 RepID=A0AAE0M9E0_9PEZI|nr:kinase-like domain-containing protein [Apodospora peruviana]
MATDDPPTDQTPGPAKLSAILVIDDEKRVRKIDDRGEHEYRQRHHQTYRDRAPITISKTCDGDPTQYILNKLSRDKNKFYLSDNAIFFIRRAKLDEIMTPEVVLRTIQHLYRELREADQALFAQEIYYGNSDGTRPPCRKLLAALILTENKSEPEGKIDTLLREGMSDDCLPMLRNGETGLLYCRLHGRDHASINSMGSILSTFRDRFTESSQRIMTPFVIYEDSAKGKHCHYILEGGGPLPMQCVPTERPHKGGFGVVQKVKIDDGDRHFTPPSYGRQGYFALKRLRLEEDYTLSHRELFDLELRSLLFAKNRGDRVPESSDTETKRHLIQLLATFEVHNSTANCTSYYFLFPWADGNLEDFWEQEDGRRNPRDKAQLVFMIDQLYYLARALQCVHNDHQRIAFDTATDRDRFGRHGDINPSNILLFRNPAEEGDRRWRGHRIVLTDFGLARLHSKQSRSKQNPKDMPKTESYSAPEYEIRDGFLSPKTDIFSLGCVFLLYVVWLLDGVDGLRKFSKARGDEKDYKYYGDNWDLDNFWKGTADAVTEHAVIKDSVKERIADYLNNSKDCVEVTGNLLKVIEKGMLQVEQKNRFAAQELVDELDRIRKKCNRADSLYFERAWKDVHVRE